MVSGARAAPEHPAAAAAPVPSGAAPSCPPPAPATGRPARRKSQPDHRASPRHCADSESCRGSHPAHTAGTSTPRHKAAQTFTRNQPISSAAVPQSLQQARISRLRGSDVLDEPAHVIEVAVALDLDLQPVGRMNDRVQRPVDAEPAGRHHEHPVRKAVRQPQRQPAAPCPGLGLGLIQPVHDNHDRLAVLLTGFLQFRSCAAASRSRPNQSGRDEDRGSMPLRRPFRQVPRRDQLRGQALARRLRRAASLKQPGEMTRPRPGPRPGARPTSTFPHRPQPG